jgi:nitrite reductase/ring-hydroxylating ferredoxin subunit
METPTLQRNIFQRLFGICATSPPSDEGCWTFEDGKLTIDLTRAPELNDRNGAIRLEKKNLPERVLVVHGNDDSYHAFKNRCAHAKRRMDPIPGTEQIQCCSVGKSTFDYSGMRLSGSAKKDIETYPVTVETDKLIIDIPK